MRWISLFFDFFDDRAKVGPPPSSLTKPAAPG
jgi:hypothetical protein